MIRATLMLIAVLVAAGCGGKKAAPPPAEESDEPECRVHDDCDEGWRCEHGECMEPLRSNNPNAKAVKDEIERRQNQHIRQVDRSLETPE